MMPKLKISAAQMVEAARNVIKEVDTQELVSRLDDPSWVIIDIRDVRERQREGSIPGSFHAPRGMLEFWVDPQSPYFKDIFADHNKTFVLHCASGWRSALSTATLQSMGFPARHLKYGFADWKKQGAPIEAKNEQSANRSVGKKV